MSIDDITKIAEILNVRIHVCDDNHQFYSSRQTKI
jgi:hypothetical protein